MLLYLL
ncbi:hypothetical protein YPPY100_3626, partial [Yersinia pestis PY-100]